MKIIKGKILKEIEEEAQYEGCTFYLEKMHKKIRNTFTNCSFHGEIIPIYVYNTLFSNCSFNGHYFV
ncbi:hypothetical protein [Candidatus Uabimicrobium sp. HlEnr_7]|uniref:hypothetical protein n=1 Tax=Candidatus Uabimicrobium helgolandensis TaxID=3095367 RepID=UPI0035577D2B